MNSGITKKIADFFSSFPLQRLTKGTILIRADQAPKGIYYLAEGYVRQYSITRTGEEMTLNIYKPYTYFPMSYAVHAYPNTYFFETMTEAAVRLAPLETVVSYVHNEPEILFDLLHRMYVGLEGILTRMEYLMTGNASKRLIAILLISAKRFGEKEKMGTKIMLRLTHADLASQAGLSRETVSRIMHQLKCSRLIGYTSASIRIYDIPRLESVLLSH